MSELVTSRGKAVFAAILPGVICILLSVAGLLREGLQGLAEILSNMGVWSYLILLLIMGATPVCSVFLYKSARGRRVPVALVLGLAILPWLAGIAGALVGIFQARYALESAPPEMRAQAMSYGVSIAATSRVLGEMLSGSLLVGVGFAYSLGTLGQKSTNRGAFAPLAGGVVALVFLGLAGFGLASIGAVFVCALFGASLFCASAIMAGLGIGDDDPERRNRSGSLAVGAILCGGLGVLLLADAGGVLAMSNSFAAMEWAAPDARMAVLARGVSEFVPMRMLRNFGGIAVLLGVVLFVVFAKGRTVMWGGRIASVVISAILVVGMVGFTFASERIEDKSIAQAATTGWDRVPDFHPVAVASQDRGSEVPHGFILPDRMITWRNEAIGFGAIQTPGGQAAFGAKLSELMNGPGPFDLAYMESIGADPMTIGGPSEIQDEVPEWLRKPNHGEDASLEEKVLESPSIVLAVDSRVNGEIFRGLLDAASAAGARKVVLVGVNENSLVSPAAANYMQGLPYFRHFLVPQTLSAEILLKEALPAGCRASELSLNYGVVGPSDSVVVYPWPGKKPEGEFEEPRDLFDVNSAGYRRGRYGLDKQVLCMAYGQGSGPWWIFRAARRAMDLSHRIMLTTKTTIEPVAPVVTPEAGVAETNGR